MSLESETLRYLGFGKAAPDEATKELIGECLAELESQITPRSVYRRFPLRFLDENTIEAAGLQVKSSALSKNLRGSVELIYFAATLGTQADRLLHRYGKLQISKAAVFQAAASSYLEDYCNTELAALAKKLEAEGLFMRPRFSPGYGDFPLEHQAGILQILDATRRLGISLTEDNFMLPEKSVTALIGLSRENSRCNAAGCELCDRADCAYRRDLK